MFRLDKKVAIITGGASGIGLAISQSFAKQGAIVHIFELNKELAEREADLIIASGGQAYCHQVDVAKQASVRKTIDKIAAAQKIDVLVNNAGIAHIGTAETTTEEDLDRVYNVNVKGVYNCIHCVIPHFKAHRSGCIINMASVASTVAVPDRFAYSMAKGAVFTMTMQVARDYVKDNIRCNSISPARIHTPFVDGFLKTRMPTNKKKPSGNYLKASPLGVWANPLK